MRPNFLLLSLVFPLLLPGLVHGQWKYEDDIQVPSSVSFSFSKKYPRARQLSWTSEQGMYMANFIEGEYLSDAVFDEGGKWIRTITTIDELVLPDAVFADVKQRFADFSYFDLIIRRDCPAGTTYEVQFFHRQADLSLLYQPDGKLLEEREH